MPNVRSFAVNQFKHKNILNSILSETIFHFWKMTRIFGNTIKRESPGNDLPGKLTRSLLLEMSYVMTPLVYPTERLTISIN